MVRGLAEASGRDLLEIAALNARYEIMYSEFSRQLLEETAEVPGPGAAVRAALPDGCTSFVALPDATAAGHVLLGENWDWIAGVRGAILRVSSPGVPEVLCFTEAGIAGGKIGLNSDGVGLVINGLASNLDSWARLRTPFHVRTWRVLTSRSLEAARDAILGEDRSCSANFMLAQARPDGTGGAGRTDGTVDAWALETAPATCAVIRPSGPSGVLAHANHFFDAGALGVWQPIDERSSTFTRCGRLQTLLERGAGALDVAALTGFLRDHEGFPLSVCSHPSPLWPEDEQYHTLFSAVMDLHARTMWASPGPPCEHEFVAYALA
jgi:isopenicillin-N N-acyltransferase-like protein